jgi:mannose-6-phosphate isomerase-like protein (cupin superfamily)
MKVARLEEIAAEGVSHDRAIRKRVLLRRGEVPHVAQLARATFEPGQVATGHAHADMWEVFVCESGRGRLTVGGETVDLRPGTCVVVEPGEQHELTNDGPERLTVTVTGLVR